MIEHIIVKLGLNKLDYDLGLDKVSRKLSTFQRQVSQISGLLRAFGIAMVIRQLVRSFEDIRDTVSQTPELFDADTIKSVERMQLALERTKETWSQLGPEAYSFARGIKESVKWLLLIPWHGLRQAGNPLFQPPSTNGSGTESQATQMGRIAGLEDILKRKQNARANVEKELERIGKARERAETNIRDLFYLQLNSSQQLRMLESEREAISRNLEKAGAGTAEHFDAQAELAKKLQEIEKKSQEIESAKTAEYEEQRQALIKLYNTRLTLEERMAALAQTKADRSKLSLEDLAYSPAFNRQAAQARAMAQGVMMLEARAPYLRLHGRGGAADMMTDRALALRGRLEPVLRSTESDPLAAVKAATEESSQNLKALREMAQSSGLVVHPKNGQ